MSYFLFQTKLKKDPALAVCLPQKTKKKGRNLQKHNRIHFRHDPFAEIIVLSISQLTVACAHLTHLLIPSFAGAFYDDPVSC